MKSSHRHALDSVWDPMGFRQHESGNSRYIPDNKPAPVLCTRLVLTCLAGTPYHNVNVSHAKHDVLCVGKTKLAGKTNKVRCCTPEYMHTQHPGQLRMSILCMSQVCMLQ